MALIDSITTYREYLQYIKNWDLYSELQKERLKKWYRDYYSRNQESERLRYRTYYANNSITEKERLNKYKKQKLVKNTISLKKKT
jgi:hypothetical protein